ncbi:MAG: YicC family protein [Alphaproteobacteria bacterium]|nr:MAG: YicC family protein [Alphaproteobacteria bacterium]
MPEGNIMSAQSMTGFAQAVAQSSNFVVSVEIKSVNNRFKDIRFKMPASLSALEIELKKELNEFFSRGTFDVYVNVKRAENKSRFDDLDANKISQFIAKIAPVLRSNNLEAKVNMTDFLRSEFFIDQDEENQTELSDLALKAFKGAVVELKNSRVSEGEKLIKVLVKHLESYRSHFVIIEANAEHFKKNVEEKLKKRVDDYKSLIDVDQSRLLQEVVFYLEKIDIHEEINRIHAHLEKFQNLLKSTNEVGRQIDFIIQELNRETNTMGSKSTMKEISDAVVQMKVQLEKMREQGLNIE